MAHETKNKGRNGARGEEKRSRENDGRTESAMERRDRENDRGAERGTQSASTRSMTPYGVGRGRMRAQSPFALMGQLSQEMDRLFEDFWRSPFSGSSTRSGRGDGGDWTSGLWMPEIEVHSHDGELVVRADLPGLSREDVQVDVTGDVLTIQGERRQGCEREHEGGGYHSECRYGSFFRSMQLPEGVEPEQVTAEFRDGVLEIRMPAPERREERRRNVEVRQGNESRGREESRSRP